jgi:hypothetical protein
MSDNGVAVKAHIGEIDVKLQKQWPEPTRDAAIRPQNGFIEVFQHV